MSLSLKKMKKEVTLAATQFSSPTERKNGEMEKREEEKFKRVFYNLPKWKIEKIIKWR